MAFFYKVLLLILCFWLIQCKQNESAENKSKPVKVSQENSKNIEHKPLEEETVKKKPQEKEKNFIQKEVKKNETVLKKKVRNIKKVVNQENRGEVAFFKSSHNYGRIEMGEKVEYAFKFVNNGEESVSIENVEVSCGCTTPIFPFFPIKPGKMGSVKVLFDSQNRLGPQESIITVFTDGKTPKIELTLVGEIITDIAQPFDSLNGENNKK